MDSHPGWVKNSLHHGGVLIIIVSLLILFMPMKLISNYWRPILAAFVFGAAVGISEIVSRYRDEPLQAIRSLYGLIYVFLNGVISGLALLLIFLYPDKFPVAKDPLLAAIAAGFGASAIMRTRIAVIKGADNKEISVGPDYVINILMQLVDRNIDRLRAEKRQSIVIDHLAQIRGMGSFDTAEKYLSTSLLAFQNLPDTDKDQLRSVINEYRNQTLPVELKYMALGFMFLTLVGERRFASVLNNATRIKL